MNLANDGGVVRDGDVLGYCRLNGITIQAWSPFQYGFFEGVFLNSPRYAQLNETLGRIGLRYNLSPAAAVIAWISRHPAGIQTIVGSTRPPGSDCFILFHKITGFPIVSVRHSGYSYCEKVSCFLGKQSG